MQTVAVVSAVHSLLRILKLVEVMTREKALEIAGTGANVISGSDQACLMNIAGMLTVFTKKAKSIAVSK